MSYSNFKDADKPAIEALLLAEKVGDMKGQLFALKRLIIIYGKDEEIKDFYKNKKKEVLKHIK